MPDTSAIVVTIDPGPGSDAEETERLTTQLRSELLQLDIDDVERISEGDAPEGTKGIELVAAGALLVKLAPSVIGAVAGTLQAWLARGDRRKITVQIGENQITLDSASDEERRRLVDAFLAASPSSGG